MGCVLLWGCRHRRKLDRVQESPIATTDGVALRSGKGLLDGLRLRGRVCAVLRDCDGEVKAIEKTDNLIVDAGLAAIIERLDSSPSTGQPTHMAVGTDGTTEDASDTALGTEIDRNALTSNTASGAVLTMVGDWAAGDGTGALQEAGIFNDPSAGTMYARVTFPTINKGASDTLQITWTFTLAADGA